MNENTQVVKKAYECFGDGNIDGLIDLFAEDIRWTIPEVNGSPLKPLTIGRENVRAFFNKLSEIEEFTSFEPKDFIAEGKKVVVLGSSSGKILSTGRNFEAEWVHIFDINDGTITNFLEFFDTAMFERAYQKAETA